MPECLRCGECCRKGLSTVIFDQEDIERLEDELWLDFHPFMFTLDENWMELGSASSFGCDTTRDAWDAIHGREEYFLKETGEHIEIPYGGSLYWCPFLQHKGDTWSCLIYENRPDICRKYYCEKAKKL